MLPFVSRRAQETETQRNIQTERDTERPGDKDMCAAGNTLYSLGPEETRHSHRCP